MRRRSRLQDEQRKTGRDEQCTDEEKPEDPRQEMSQGAYRIIEIVHPQQHEFHMAWSVYRERETLYKRTAPRCCENTHNDCACNGPCAEVPWQRPIHYCA